MLRRVADLIQPTINNAEILVRLRSDAARARAHRSVFMRGDRLRDLQRFFVTSRRAVSVAEICGVRLSLHVADFQIGVGELELQRAIAARFERELVEIFERATDNQLPRGSRSRQIRDRVVELKKE